MKQRSKQHPTKGGGSSGSYSEDDLSFNNVYQSEAARSYREQLAKKVESTLLGYINSRKCEEEAKAEVSSNAVDSSYRDPFQQIMSQNSMSVGSRLPGLCHINRPQSSHDASAIPRRSSSDSGPSSIDQIKQRIDSRRRSIAIEATKK